MGNERVFRPERETTRAVLTAVDIKIETRFLIGIWKPTPISGVMLADAYGTLRERPVIRACWACNTVPVTLELFNHKRQSRELATHSGVS